MTWQILISAPYMIPFMDRFKPMIEARGAVVEVAEVEERLEEETLLDMIAPFDGVICGDDRFTRRVMEKATRLKVISKWGTGIDSIDQKAAKALGIAVCNTPGAFTDPVADTVMSYVLSFARATPWQDKAMKAGHWEKLPGYSLSEWSLGIVGLGQIGRAVAKRAEAFGMRLLGTDPVHPSETFLKATGLTLCSLEEVLKKADVVSLHCDLNPSSYHLMNKVTLNMMKEQAYLINTARGPIIEEPALVEALKTHHLAGAALDVYAHEPLPVDSSLRHMDQVLLAAHNANSSPVCWERVHQNSILNLFKVLEGRS